MTDPIVKLFNAAKSEKLKQAGFTRSRILKQLTPKPKQPRAEAVRYAGWINKLQNDFDKIATTLLDPLLNTFKVLRQDDAFTDATANTFDALRATVAEVLNPERIKLGVTVNGDAISVFNRNKCG